MSGCMLIRGRGRKGSGVNNLREQKQPAEYSNQAKKYISRQDGVIKRRIKTAIENIPLGDITPYKSQPGYFRLRFGDFRVLFRWLSDVQILVSVIEGRGHAYKKGV